MFEGEEYELQEKVPAEEAEYGIAKYTPLQQEFHQDVMRLLKSKKYESLAMDDAMVVFGRVYSVYELSQLKKEGKIKPVGEESLEKSKGDKESN